jgi:hypothetical protein
MLLDLCKKTQSSIGRLREDRLKLGIKGDFILRASVFFQLSFLTLLRAFLRACVFLFVDDPRYFLIFNGIEKNNSFSISSSYCVYKRFKRRTAGFSKTALAVIIIASVIGSSSLYVLMNIYQPDKSTYPTEAAGEAWLTGYNYRKKITITGQSGAGSNYQVKLTIGSSAGGDFNLGGAALSFPNDIRFTDDDGSTQLDYWIENIASDPITVWVEVADSLESNVDIYIYYGKSSDTTTSNIGNTFILGDDFSGGSVDTSKWDIGYNAPNTADDITVTNGELRFYGRTNSDYEYARITSKTSFTTAFVLEGKQKSQTTTGSAPIFGYTNSAGSYTRGAFFWQHWGNDLIGKYDNFLTAWGPMTVTNIYYKLKLIYTAPGFEMYVDDVQKVDNNTWTNPNSVDKIVLEQGYSNGARYYAYFDDVRVRKYAATEPAFSSAGSQEVANTAPTATAPTASQATDGTGYVTIQTTIDDADDNNTVRFQVEYSLDNGSTWTNGDPYLVSYITTSPSQATQPDVTNAQAYQVGMPTNNIITSAGANTVTIKWDTKSASNGTGAIGSEASVKLRITPHDGTSAGIPVASVASFAIDNTAPTSGAIQINSNDAYTTSANTTLTLSATGASQMKFSNDNATYSAYEAYDVSKAWDIVNATYGGNSSDGAKTVYVIFKDSFGNEATAINDNIIYDTTAPTNPTAAVDGQGAVTDTWQNNKSDPDFTSFTGESDANGIAGFYAYFGASSAGADTNNWVASDAFNPASFTGTSGVRYLRVISKDNAGLYADPDGAGTACDNANANRPTDADCWATIFVHKYDIDNPNTPSPSASPVSWNSTNSFDFSWSDPGDVGGSGVYNYTYFTNAGTSSTDTANIYANSLTSDSAGAKLFSVKANDNAGNSGTDGVVNFYYDNIAPTNAGTATDGNGSLDNAWGIVSDPSFTWTAGSDANSGVKEYDVYWGTSSTGTSVTATTASNSYDPSAIPVNTPYYLRIRTRDNVLNESAWETKFTMKYSQAPSNPSGLSQTANAASLALGGWTDDATPTLNFTLTDLDADTLGYIIKIDNNSDFSSLEVFYTYSANDLTSGAENSFLVGQAPGTGTYTNGAENQTLAEGEYYWKVQAVESHGLASSEATANSGLVAFGVDASDPTGATLGFGATTSSSITAAISGATDSVSGLHALPYYFEITSPITPNSGWQTETSWSLGALTANTQYTYQATARDKADNAQTTATQNKYTLANIPSAPTVNNALPTSLDVDINVNSNPASTEFAIYKEIGASCDGAGGSYLAANGSDNGATAVWQTDPAWGTKTATGLSESVQYSFCVKARNGESVETAFGSAASASTIASNIAPNVPVLIFPASGSYVNDATPTLSANYSDPDAGDAGTTNYRIASTDASDCVNNLNIVGSGTSSATSDEDEDTIWTPLSSVGADGTYYWCAQNNDSAATSNWTSMGSFILDVSAPAGATLSAGTATTSSVSVSVSGASDSGSGLHSTPYYFENTTSLTNSGWTTNASWTSSSLACGATYSFRVKTKDALGNESAFTSSSSFAAQSCGGGAPPAVYNPPANPSSTPSNPAGKFKVIINDDASHANSHKITLKFAVGADTKRMAISEFADFRSASQIPFQKELKWELLPAAKSQSPTSNTRTVYVKFYTANGAASEVFSDSIILDASVPEIIPAPDPTPESANPLAPEVAKKEENVSVPAPSSDIASNEPEPASPYFQSPPNKLEPVNPDWNLIPVPEIKNFFPQKNEISFFAQKFSSLSRAFAKLNIVEVKDISSRARGASFKIPGLMEIINSPKTAFFPPVPLADLSKKQKQKIPTEIPFVSAASEKINLSSVLVLDEDNLKQKISAPSSANLNIAVKPEHSAKSISGYIALKKNAYSFNDKLQMSNVKSMSNYEMINYQNNSGVENLKLKISSLLGFKNVIAQEVEPIEPEVNPQSVEQRFVLAQFQYADSDQDGIWTADIQTPAVVGEYEIISLINYQDSNISPKEIRLIAIIDPEGYVFEKINGQELRIKNAVVSIYSLNSGANEYELWPAQDYGQKNPQTTDITGKYSFLVPAGSYYIKAEAPGYRSLQTDTFEVSETNNAHMELELIRKYNWKNALTWERIFLILIIGLIAFNFYRNRKRKT